MNTFGIRNAVRDPINFTVGDKMHLDTKTVTVTDELLTDAVSLTTKVSSDLSNTSEPIDLSITTKELNI